MGEDIEEYHLGLARTYKGVILFRWEHIGRSFLDGIDI